MNLIKKFFCGFIFFILSAIIIYRENNLLEKEYYIYKSDKILYVMFFNFYVRNSEKL